MKNAEFYCENYFVDDDDDDDCECGCNENGDDNNGLFQFHILVSSTLSIVSLKVFTVTAQRPPLLLYKGHVNALFPVQVFC